MSDQPLSQRIDLDGSDVPFSPIVGAVLTKMFEDSAATTNALISNYQHQVATLKAELEIIREGVGELLSSPYAPNTYRIEQAVFDPSQEQLRIRRDEILAAMGRSDG